MPKTIPQPPDLKIPVHENVTGWRGWFTAIQDMIASKPDGFSKSGRALVRLGSDIQDANGKTLAAAKLLNSHINANDLQGSGKVFTNLPASGATVGAQTGTNLVDSTGTVQTDAQTLNRYIDAFPSGLVISLNASLIFTVTANSVVLKDANGDNVTVRNVSIPSVALGSLWLDSGGFSVAGVGKAYYLYIIWDGTNVQLLASLNSTSPSFTAYPDYTYFKKVGFVLVTAASGGLATGAAQFTQIGNYYQYVVPTIALSTTAAGYSSTDISVFVPPGASDVGIFSIGVSAWTSGNVGAAISADGVTVYSTAAMVQGTAWIGPQAAFTMAIPNGQTVYLAQVGAGAGTAAIYVWGCLINI